MTNRPQKIFLTEKRRRVLEGDTDDMTDQQIAAHKHRTRVRARMALEELIETYSSNEIDNEDLFEAEDIHRLTQALVHPTEITPRTEYDGEDWSEEYAYEQSIISEARRAATILEIQSFGLENVIPEGTKAEIAIGLPVTVEGEGEPIESSEQS